MKKWKSVAAALMLTVSMGMGVSAETTESLNVAVTKDENTLSPFTYVSGTGLTVNRLIFDPLLTYRCRRSDHSLDGRRRL